MPVYEYKCLKCGKFYSEIRTITHYAEKGPRADCDGDGCDGELQRIVNPIGFVLDGDGWPSQDLRNRTRG